MPGEVNYPTETTRTSQPAGGSKQRGVAGRLQRNLGRLDIIFLTIAATISTNFSKPRTSQSATKAATTRGNAGNAQTPFDLHQFSNIEIAATRSASTACTGFFIDTPHLGERFASASFSILEFAELAQTGQPLGPKMGGGKDRFGIGLPSNLEMLPLRTLS